MQRRRRFREPFAVPGATIPDGSNLWSKISESGELLVNKQVHTALGLSVVSVVAPSDLGRRSGS